MSSGYGASFEPAMRAALAQARAAASVSGPAGTSGPASASWSAGAAGPAGAATRPSRGEAPAPVTDDAALRGDVPVGAVITGPDGDIIAQAGNRREADTDPTAHAEVVAIREAARRLGSWRLAGCTLVVTLEPCTMCAGAVVAARLARLVYGASDPKGGAAGSLWDVLRDQRLSHRPEVIGGVLAADCGELLREFFARRRGRSG